MPLIMSDRNESFLTAERVLCDIYNEQGNELQQDWLRDKL